MANKSIFDAFERMWQHVVAFVADKQDKITGAATTITSNNLLTSRALVSNSSGKVSASAITTTELGYLDGVTSNIQTQLDSKLKNASFYSVADETALQAKCEELYRALPDASIGEYVFSVNGSYSFITMRKTDSNYGTFERIQYSGSGAYRRYASMYSGSFTGWKDPTSDGSEILTTDNWSQHISVSGGTSGTVREFDSGAISVNTYCPTHVSTKGSKSRFYFVTIQDPNFTSNLYTVAVDYRSVRAGNYNRDFTIVGLKNEDSLGRNTIITLNVTAVADTSVTFTCNTAKIVHVCGYY